MILKREVEEEEKKKNSVHSNESNYISSNDFKKKRKFESVQWKGYSRYHLNHNSNYSDIDTLKYKYPWLFIKVNYLFNLI